MDEEHLERFRQAIASRYRVERRLGHGGMAMVYLAHDLRHDRQVALKVLDAEQSTGVAAERFAREVRITAQLNHPHIVPLLDSGEAGGHLYYVMPVVSGESLADRLGRDPQLPLEEAVRIACEAAEALAYAHEHGVLHRDVKPQNILFEGKHALVSDFGIARALGLASGESLTSTGITVGTVGYMSPEQAGGTRDLDRRSDIYSLGIVLYQMLAGDPPFTGPTPQAVLARQAAGVLPSLRVVRETVSPRLERAILKALAIAPADRFQTATEFKEALERIDPNDLGTTSSPRWRRAVVGVSAAAAVLVGATLLRNIIGSPPTLDSDRIVVYPLVAPTDAGDGRVGEDVATMIGHALDRTGPLRWIDGWTLLDERMRNDVRALSLARAASIARDQRSAYFVVGRVAMRSDSAHVFLELHDVEGDSSLATANATAAASEGWRAGLRAVSALLPTLIPTGAPIATDHLEHRNPAAVANFLLGESDYRRAHFEDAMAHYAAAVEDDSMFALAAIRGAQAAGWHHYSSDARAFIRSALAHSEQLLPRDEAFARGYDAFLEGNADRAILQFQRAIRLDPHMAVAWSQLGDVYTHLLPRAGRADSMAEAALVEGYRLDSTGVHLLFHVAEIALRKGEAERASRLAARFMEEHPDSALSRRIELMTQCVVDGADAVDWNRAGRDSPGPLLSAATSLAVAGSQLPCAERAFRAVLSADTVSDAWGAGRRWSALLGLQSLYFARGNEGAIVRLLDSAAQGGLETARVLYMLDAALGASTLADSARQVALLDQRRYGADYRASSFPTRLWVLALWEASQGRADRVTAIAEELLARADTSQDRRLRLTARAVAAHAALARADTTDALGRLRALAPTAPPDTMTWHLVEPLGAERLLLARLLLAGGNAREAIDVADVFDSAEPAIYLLYLRPSLEVRLQAAESLGLGAMARRYRQRLAQLTEPT